MLSLTLLLLACADDPKPTEPSAPRPAAAAPQAAPERMAARHILVAYQGALGAQPAVRRSKEEAELRARELLVRLRAGEDFGHVAREASDDASGVRGGELGAFASGQMVAAFEAATAALEPGELSDLVESPFGYHIIQREALEEARLYHILVQWQNPQRPDLARTQEQARARAEEALAKLNAGEPFDAVAAQYSDSSAADYGGDLGWFQRGQLAPVMDEAAFALQPGQTSGLIETPLGYHILRRAQ